MKIESPAFTMDDIRTFMASYRDRERNLLADRLQRVSDRVRELGPHVVRAVNEDDPDWNAHEILAHIAVVSKFYGILVHRIASGKLTDMNLLGAVNMRDDAGRRMAEQTPEELVSQTLADQQRTLEILRTSDSESLERSARMDDGTPMTAEQVARLPLIAHLEMHVEQLEKMLQTAKR
ncbi:MAG TPA: DinB family protein [Candidatus Dormibacteraeota bacterium]|nr:DinB family protein [Candidatus Dormibacteraeota bacterium]